MRDPGPAARDSRLAAQLARAATPPGTTPRGEPTGPYEDWTLVQLRRHAAAAGVVGRSRLRKDDLIRALRSPSGQDT